MRGQKGIEVEGLRGATNSTIIGDEATRKIKQPTKKKNKRQK
jgi:hypothetical protein